MRCGLSISISAVSLVKGPRARRAPEEDDIVRKQIDPLPVRLCLRAGGGPMRLLQNSVLQEPYYLFFRNCSGTRPKAIRINLRWRTSWPVVREDFRGRFVCGAPTLWRGAFRQAQHGFAVGIDFLRAQMAFPCLEDDFDGPAQSLHVGHVAQAPDGVVHAGDEQVPIHQV
jgi:hypothetical protein